MLMRKTFTVEVTYEKSGGGGCVEPEQKHIREILQNGFHTKKHNTLVTKVVNTKPEERVETS